MERLDAFMARANAAYYATRDPFADFTTAPEISQAFGEVLGLWAAVTWTMLGRPSPILLVEAGPGRGTLMADALRAIRRAMPDFAAALAVHLIETSDRLRAEQAALVGDATWHDRPGDVPAGPFILLANEFLDALPIRQFVRRGEGWAERFVTPAGFVEQASSVVPWPDPLPEGTIVEQADAAASVAGWIGRRLADAPGAALFLDYGPERSAPGDSLQALSGKVPVDPLTAPGSADLTAHVDFAAFARAATASGARVHGPIPQGLFLVRLGLFQRANRLAQGVPQGVPQGVSQGVSQGSPQGSSQGGSSQGGGSQGSPQGRRSPAEAAAIMEAARRLAEPNRMGRLFKALAVTRPGLPDLPGFVA
jgi:SAM-dependent MidA family methyltransferase